MRTDADLEYCAVYSSEKLFSCKKIHSLRPCWLKLSLQLTHPSSLKLWCITQSTSKFFFSSKTGISSKQTTENILSVNTHPQAAGSRIMWLFNCTSCAQHVLLLLLCASDFINRRSLKQMKSNKYSKRNFLLIKY